MHITLLGATGPTGQLVLERALKAGHRVTALVRDPARLPQRDNLDVTVVTGDATSAEDLKRALAGSQAVVSALGPGKARTSDLASRTARALVPAAESTGVRRVVVLSAFGVGDTLRDYKAVPRIAIKLLLSDVFGDKAVADDLLRSSGLDWTLVYPTILTNGPFTGTYTVLETPTSKVGGRVGRADVADFMLRQAESEEWSRRTAVLTG
ncbi:NAD(P)-dependent oxidoreductase [Streptomyces liliifuscus]|uniref:SDR family oxidoreductase n=1 Tax=Streptomyces liliifuscus TaxID=2797636 RepID=A0A7T7L379_9ACTN|nr:NAD(P)-binding oxidoreductase [Streptomyces liliifuscus]QQM45602.1 SDR family oxidoreductase [Streptomyces liliifuscus]